MSFEETVALAKLLSVALGFDKPNVLSDIDLDILKDLFKRMADNSPNWNQEQKDAYKLLVDVVKENHKKI